jgi:thiol-disulfide isomerase/thioredoxin
MDQVSTVNDFVALLTDEPMVLAYFSHEGCSVCRVLKPKVFELLENEFPKIKAVSVDTVLSPELAAQNRVFGVPSILVFFEGREYFRFSRNIGIGELRESIMRPYKLMIE